MNTKTRALLVGGSIGLSLGILAGWLYYNSNVEVDEVGNEKLDSPSPGDALKVGLSALGLLRMLTG